MGQREIENVSNIVKTRLFNYASNHFLAISHYINLHVSASLSHLYIFILRLQM